MSNGEKASEHIGRAFLAAWDKSMSETPQTEAKPELTLHVCGGKQARRCQKDGGDVPEGVAIDVQEIADNPLWAAESWANDRAAVADLTAKLAQAEQRGTWQPIETAPKDGRKVLTYQHDAGIRVAHCEGGEWWWCSYEYTCEPSHWMPLPAPPQKG